MIPRKFKRVMPGFGVALGITVFYVGMLILLPVSALFLKLSSLTWTSFWTVVTSDRAVAAYQLSFSAAFFAALVNVFIGVLLAWVLVRYRFPGRQIMEALIDLPFALPTAVAGITLTTIYCESGWLGGMLSDYGIKVAYAPTGVFLALVFVGLPFVVRSVQPILRSLEQESEEAAATLGASPLRIFISVILPGLWPGILAGFSLAFARGLGEYGSVVFISGNLPYKTEIVPLLIMNHLEQFDYASASALAVTMLLVSFCIMFGLNFWQLRGTDLRET